MTKFHENSNKSEQINNIDNSNNSNNTNNKLKEKKQKNALYWSAKLGPCDKAFDHPVIKQILDDNKDLVKLNEIHSTLLYMGRKINENEEFLIKIKGQKCIVSINGFGYSNCALALSVENVKLETGDDVPFFEKKQHITMALKEGTSAKDSVETLLGNGTFVPLEGDKLQLHGTIFQHMF